MQPASASLTGEATAPAMPAEPALAEPASAGPAPDPAQVARQHALNQRYWNAMLGPAGAGTERGRWWRDVDKTMYAVAASGDVFVDIAWTIAADGKRVEHRGTYELDPATGTWTAHPDGQPPRVLRVATANDGEFTVEVLPGPGAATGEAVNPPFRVGFSPTGAAVTFRVAGQVDSNFVWLPQGDVIAMFEQAVAARAAAFAQQQAAQAEAQRLAVEQILAQQRAYAAQNAQQELLDAQADYEFERERQEKAARWAQASGAAERGLADSISRLNNTVSAVEAQQAQYRAQQEAIRAQQEAAARVADAQRAREATERQYEIARQYEAQRQAQAQQAAAAAVNTNAGSGHLTVESGARPAQASPETAGIARPATTGGNASASADEPVMGFTGKTCADARAGAQRWVGSGGSFEVKSEGPGYGGTCLVQIRNWKSGPGTSSAQ